LRGTGVRAVTNAAGLKAERSLFRPFGEEASTRFDLATAVETKGFIEERFDADAGLQYLNARYYDPKLGTFIQPDWWEVTKAGVGTNRYGYSGGDPVNGADPSGHGFWRDLGKATGDFFRAVSGNSGSTVGSNGAARSTKSGQDSSRILVNASNTNMNGSGTNNGKRLIIGSGKERIWRVDDSTIGNGVLGCMARGGSAASCSRIPFGRGGGIVSGATAAGIAVGSGKLLLDRYKGMVSDGTGTNANSLMSPRSNELYRLVRTANPSEVYKYGITSAPGAPEGRYTQDYMDRMGLRYVPMNSFNNRLEARIAEVGANLSFFSEYGRLPPGTLRW
jgi:RHS repeat-associated protein